MRQKETEIIDKHGPLFCEGCGASSVYEEYERGYHPFDGHLIIKRRRVCPNLKWWSLKWHLGKIAICPY